MAIEMFEPSNLGKGIIEKELQELKERVEIDLELKGITVPLASELVGPWRVSTQYLNNPENKKEKHTMTVEEFKNHNWKMVVTPELSEHLQKAAFKHGYRWGKGQAEVLLTDVPFLYMTNDKQICVRSHSQFFMTSLNDSISADEAINILEHSPALPKEIEEILEGSDFGCQDENVRRLITALVRLVKE
jgi:hypothetical protein